VAHRCAEPAESPTGCGTELSEYATVVRSAAGALTSAISGRPPKA
jgi:hypothetical protein